MSHGDALRTYYVVLNCSNLILAQDINLNLVEFDWNSVDSVLMLNKFIVTVPKMYTVTFGCKKNAKGFCFSCTKFCKCNREDYHS